MRPLGRTILVVGHLTDLVVLVQLSNGFAPPSWFEFVFYLPLIGLLSLMILPRCKGVISAVFWKTKAEGSEIT
jgi:uncharacterized protein (DUF983 family)